MTEARCVEDGDFVPMLDPIPGNNQLRALMSRHVDCRSGESGPVALHASHRTEEPGAEDVAIAAIPDGEVGEDTVGTVRVASRMSVYGPSNVTGKRVSPGDSSGQFHAESSLSWP